MPTIDRLRALGLFDSRVPRYTSYPTAPVFKPLPSPDFQAQALSAINPAEPVSVYVHIPFCERLCWFCACLTQGTKTRGPLEAYLVALERELALIAHCLPEGVRMGRLHWGGGTPTILHPDMIHRLARAVKAVFPPHDDFEFSVEIDPTTVDGDKIHALAEEGLNRASIGIQDFDPVVQEAIGRIQSFDTTDACVGALRDEGVGSLNTDLVYGLPHQDSARLAGTLEQVLRLAPDRIALFGYAHVPWMSKRQRLIDESVLPDDLARYALAEQAASRFAAAGFEPIGIDHFARPGDSLQEAAASGRLRRNFQGYTDDVCPTLIGVGASSISRFAQGYVQNAHKTADYMRSVGEGQLAGARGHALSEEDRLRARAIEMLMCDFRLDRTALARQFGESAARLDLVHALVSERFGDLVALSDEALEIRPEGRALTRIIAGSYDAYAPEGVRYSRAT